MKGNSSSKRQASAGTNAVGNISSKRAASSTLLQSSSSHGNIHSHSHNQSGESPNEDNHPGSATLYAKINFLEKDIERRQESYISRERAYKVRIDELEEELTNQKQLKTGWMKSDSKISKLKSMQNQILNNVELVQDRTARIMQEQERDLLRAFRARLFDVQTELEKEKSKKDDGAVAWIEKSRQLESEVEWAKEVADRLERANQSLLQENARLKSQFSSQEEDRNFLIKQLVAVKKDNARLRAEYNEIELETEEARKRFESANNQQSLASRSVGGAGGDNKIAESEEKFKEVNIRLRRLLAEERKSLQQVRTNYSNELKARTEMEMLLRNCVEDVRREIARRHVESAQFSNGAVDNMDLTKLYTKDPSLRPVHEFTQEDRERALELLLSQERVVSLIYAKTFPVQSGTSNLKTNANSGFDQSSNNVAMPGMLSNEMSEGAGGGGGSKPGTAPIAAGALLPSLPQSRGGK